MKGVKPDSQPASQPASQPSKQDLVSSVAHILTEKDKAQRHDISLLSPPQNASKPLLRPRRRSSRSAVERSLDSRRRALESSGGPADSIVEPLPGRDVGFARRRAGVAAHCQTGSGRQRPVDAGAYARRKTWCNAGRDAGRNAIWSPGCEVRVAVLRVD